MARLRVVAGRTCALVALLIISSASARAQNSGAAFLNIPTSPRAYSLGQSNIAAVGAQAIGRNPANAGLTFERFELFSSFATMMGGAQYGHIAAIYAPDRLPLDAFGFAVTRLQNSGFERADSLGTKTGGTFGGGDLALSFTGSGKLSPDLRLGATAKVLQSEIAQYKSGMSLAGDFGATYTVPNLSKPLSIALSVTNFGQGIKFLDQRDPLPTSVNLGLAAHLGPIMTLLEVNRMIPDHRNEFGFGAEYGVGPVAFRLGYLMSNTGSNPAANDQKGAAKILQGLAYGFGLQVGQVKVDYAMSEQAVEFGPTHRLGLTIKWGSKETVKYDGGGDWNFRSDRADWLVTPWGTVK